MFRARLGAPEGLAREVFAVSTTLEMRMQLWFDKTGDRIEVGEDGDGLSLLELRYVDSEGKILDRIICAPEDAPKLAQAIQKVADYMVAEGSRAAEPKDPTRCDTCGGSHNPDDVCFDGRGSYR